MPIHLNLYNPIVILFEIKINTFATYRTKEIFEFKLNKLNLRERKIANNVTI